MTQKPKTAVVLAAGLGSRLGPKTKSLPKCMLDVGGMCLIERSLSHCSAAGIETAIVVIGHEGAKIESLVGSQFGSLPVSYVQNPDFAATGSMASLQLAIPHTKGDIILLESDLLYESTALDILLNHHSPNAVLTAKLSGSGDEVFVATNELGHIVRLGKEITPTSGSEIKGELVGITKLSKAYLDGLYAEYEDRRLERWRSSHYEEILVEYGNSTLQPMVGCFATDLKWIEIDTEKDLRRAKQQIFPLIANPDKSQVSSIAP